MPPPRFLIPTHFFDEGEADTVGQVCSSVPTYVGHEMRAEEGYVPRDSIVLRRDGYTVERVAHHVYLPKRKNV